MLLSRLSKSHVAVSAAILVTQTGNELDVTVFVLNSDITGKDNPNRTCTTFAIKRSAHNEIREVGITNHCGGFSNCRLPRR